MTADMRIERALGYALKYSGIDGAHHKAWTIDQMVRALTGCPLEEISQTINGKVYKWDEQGKSKEYKNFVKKACAGENGPNTYEWDEGITP